MAVVAMVLVRTRLDYTRHSKWSATMIDVAVIKVRNSNSTPTRVVEHNCG